jgi:hypothetical protein
LARSAPCLDTRLAWRAPTRPSVSGGCTLGATPEVQESIDLHDTLEGGGVALMPRAGRRCHKHHGVDHHPTGQAGSHRPTGTSTQRVRRGQPTEVPGRRPGILGAPIGVFMDEMRRAAPKVTATMASKRAGAAAAPVPLRRVPCAIARPALRAVPGSTQERGGLIRRNQMKRSPRQGSARRPTPAVPMSPQAKRRQRSATVAVRRDTTLVQSKVPRRVESRMAPPRYAERQHARPGAGIKRSRANMSPRSR